MKLIKRKTYNKEGSYLLVLPSGEIVGKFRTKITAKVNKKKLEKIYIQEIEIKVNRDRLGISPFTRRGWGL